MKKLILALALLFQSFSSFASGTETYTIAEVRCLAVLGGANIWQDCTPDHGTSISLVTEAEKQIRVIESRGVNVLFELLMNEAVVVDESTGERIVTKTYFRQILDGFSWEKSVRNAGRTAESITVRFSKIADNRYVLAIVDSKGDSRTFFLHKNY